MRAGEKEGGRPVRGKAMGKAKAARAFPKLAGGKRPQRRGERPRTKHSATVRAGETGKLA